MMVPPAEAAMTRQMLWRSAGPAVAVTAPIQRTSPLALSIPRNAPGQPGPPYPAPGPQSRSGATPGRRTCSTNPSLPVTGIAAGVNPFTGRRPRPAAAAGNPRPSAGRSATAAVCAGGPMGIRRMSATWR
ncbi:hypothetical protein JCM13210_01750 [Thermaerobacter litoralis]